MADARYDVTSFGEMLLRLSVPSGTRLESTRTLDLHPAGAEANVISLLARLGYQTLWLGTLPQNPLGRLAATALRTAGVDTEHIHWQTNGRMGTYYVEFGAPPRGIQVTYDRTHSVTTLLTPDQIDWSSLLNTRLLHLTGITPPLSAGCEQIVRTAIKQANARGVPISFDVNYRQKLWPPDQARKTLEPLIQEVELLFCSLRDAEQVFGCSGSPEEIRQELLVRSHAKNIVLTQGDAGAWLFSNGKWQHEPARATQIIDRLGAGDALAAGVIAGWLEHDLQKGLRQGITLAALALSQRGDMLITSQSELQELSENDSFLSR